MNTIKDYSFLLLEEIPLEELPQGVAEIVGDYRYEGNINMNEAMDMIEECYKDEMLQWIQTNNELAEIFPEDEE
jgi:hypothetical protein